MCVWGVLALLAGTDRGPLHVTFFLFLVRLLIPDTICCSEGKTCWLCLFFLFVPLTGYTCYRLGLALCLNALVSPLLDLFFRPCLFLTYPHHTHAPSRSCPFSCCAQKYISFRRCQIAGPIIPPHLVTQHLVAHPQYTYDTLPACCCIVERVLGFLLCSRG